MLFQTRVTPLARTLAMAGAGLLLPFLWPGLATNLLTALPMAGHAAHEPGTLSSLQLGADLLIGVSYTVIAGTLGLIVHRHRRALPFDWVVLAFGLFIVACGFTHFMHVLVRATPLFWLDGYVRAVTALVSVATAVALPPLLPRFARLLEAERQVAESRRELERTNAALREAVALAERQRDALEAANARLRATNAELESFAYVASHDLQEPLRTIASFGALVERRYGERLDETGRGYLRHVTHGAERLKALIADLLAFARLGEGAPEIRPVSLEDVLADVLERLEGALRDSGARVTHDPLPTVSGRAPELAQVLQNLLGNALKFRREGDPPEVHLSASREGDEWHLRVRDNGIGIEPQYAERVFGVFQRLHARETYEGNGIGLAIVQKIVQRHGGRIGVEPHAGPGTTIHFTLPAVERRPELVPRS